jgi:SAM-dependent methyltransferase
MNDDVFGQELWNSYNNKLSFQVVERDDGYVQIDQDAHLYFKEYRHWKKTEKLAIRYAKGECLDIGCGAGRVLLYLQEKGYNPIGIDTSKLAVRVCKLRGVKNAIVMDINNINKFKPSIFDSILLFGNNFGLLENCIKAKKLLKIMYRITSKNGVIIAESRDPYITDNPVHLKYHKINLRKNRMPGQLRLRVRFMQYSTKWFDYLYISKKEMKGLLIGTGWKIKRFIDSEDFKNNGQYIAIIEKI